jgi:hypothetical protein
MGQALHAVEDSFTHSYRTPDEMKITVVLNWVDQINGTLVESRDGPGHALALDHCDDADALRTTRHELAVAAVTSVLRATLDPSQSTAQKMAAVSGVLDQYLSYSPGCTYANAWCDAPEVIYKDPSGCACNAGGGGGGIAATACAVALTILGVFRRRRRPGVAAMMTVVPTLGLSVAAGPAAAQTMASAPTPAIPTGEPTAVSPSTTSTTTTPLTVQAPTEPHEPPTAIVTPVQGPVPPYRSGLLFGGYVGASGSIDKASVAGGVGLRLRVSKHWAFGLDAEWNPWVAYLESAVRSGVVNVYGTAMLRFPLAYERFNLRITASAGTSYLLTNLYGAPSGTIGLFLGGSPLSLEWKMSRHFYLIIDPDNIAIPAPQLHGVPLIYQEYRATIGIEIYAG